MDSSSQGSLFQPEARDLSLRVGPAGWSYKDWEGIVYPAQRGRSFDSLSYLAEYFDTIEINSSFYHPPVPGVAAAWVRRVSHNPGFRFTAKTWQRLSHEAREANDVTVASNCDEVRRSMAPLAEKGVLGVLLVQFPWSFRYAPENLDYIEKIIGTLREFPLAVEVRHGSWNRDSFYDLLREYRTAFCNVDQPVIGDSLHLTRLVTSRIGYCRLHGRNYKDWFREKAGRDARYNYLYSKEEIRQIAKEIRTVKQSAEETYVITNNHFQGKAVVNALDILEEFDRVPPQSPGVVETTYAEHFRGTSD